MRFKDLLLIDDDLEDRELFLAALDTLNTSARCLAVGSGMEALDKLGRGKDMPDVIILDLNMPLMNGYEFLMAIQQNPVLTRIPVYVMTTTTDVAALLRAEKLGATAAITKPTSHTELVTLIKLLVF